MVRVNTGIPLETQYTYTHKLHSDAKQTKAEMFCLGVSDGASLLKKESKTDFSNSKRLI